MSLSFLTSFLWSSAPAAAPVAEVSVGPQTVIVVDESKSKSDDSCVSMSVPVMPIPVTEEVATGAVPMTIQVTPPASQEIDVVPSGAVGTTPPVVGCVIPDELAKPVLVRENVEWSKQDDQLLTRSKLDAHLQRVCSRREMMAELQAKLFARRFIDDLEVRLGSATRRAAFMCSLPTDLDIAVFSREMRLRSVPEEVPEQKVEAEPVRPQLPSIIPELLESLYPALLERLRIDHMVPRATTTDSPPLPACDQCVQSCTVCRDQARITEERNEADGALTRQAAKLKSLEAENTRLRGLIAHRAEMYEHVKRKLEVQVARVQKLTVQLDEVVQTAELRRRMADLNRRNEIKRHRAEKHSIRNQCRRILCEGKQANVEDRSDDD
jgi:hypothetical protein